MNLSKSRYCRGLQCKKMLWLEDNKPEEREEIGNSSILEQGNLIHEVARYLFGSHVNIEYTENLKEMIKDTYRTIESYKDVIITEASFDYENNFCSVDILKKMNEKYEIYEVKSSTKVEDKYINDIAYQYYVLTSLGFNVTKCSIVVINRAYMRNGSIELNKLFKKEDVTITVRDMQDEVKKNIEDINEYLKQESEPYEDIDKKCFKPYACLFFKYCSRHLPKKNIFDLSDMHVSTKVKHYQKGICSYEDILREIDDKKIKQVIEFDLYDKEDYVDKVKINEFLNSLTYPLYFLDFETFAPVVPMFDGTHPFERIPFQYSLHYLEKANDTLKHKEFLAEAGIDPRRSLAERLVKDIPENSCVLAYNMSFEKGVIKELAASFPDLSSHLMNIHNNIKDLMNPFKYRAYYSKNMHGSYSIKKVLPSLFPDDPSLDYHNLELVHNGDEAMNIYALLGSMSPEEVMYTRDRLLKYCYLDTYAMVKIYEKLKEVTR